MYKTDFSKDICGNCGGRNYTNYHDCLSCRSRGEQCAACRMRTLADARQLLATAFLKTGRDEYRQAYNGALALAEQVQAEAV